MIPPAPKRWQVLSPSPASQTVTGTDIPSLLVQILYNRGITDTESMELFLTHEETAPPFQMGGMSEAVGRIRRAIKKSERIAVYGDYDADGVTATALMVETLSALGGRVTWHIPSRGDSGYGLNRPALDQIARNGVTLIVTVDCGVRALSELRYAARLGLDVIVTDHHTVGDTLPPAWAIINPKQSGCPYPFREFSGVGLAFKLAQGLLRAENQVPLKKRRRGLHEDDLLDLVALGTVADLVPLVGENRWLVAHGLERLRQTQRPGLQKLMQLAGVDPNHVDSEAVGYRLGPRINAAGRLASAATSLRLLITSDEEEAGQLAQELDELNRKRQKLTGEMVELALNKLGDTTADILIVEDRLIPEGLMGLVASSLVEVYYRPAIAISKGDEVSRGSARSIQEFHITEALDRCAHHFVRHGGHAMAAGFTIRNDELAPFRADIETLASRWLADQDLCPTLVVDAEIPLAEATPDLCAELRRLAPFGYGNQTPVLASSAVDVKSHFRVGAKGKHLKLYLANSDSGRTWEGIGFGLGDWNDTLPDRIDVAYHLEINRWNNEARLQLNIQDLRPAS